MVEAGELVGVQPHRPSLQREVRRGLADVVERIVAVRRRVGLLTGPHVGRGEEHDRGPRHPAGVAPAQVGDEPLVVGRAGTQTKYTHGWLLPALGAHCAARSRVSISASPSRCAVVVHAGAPARPHRLGEVLGAGLGSLGMVGVGHRASMPRACG